MLTEFIIFHTVQQHYNNTCSMTFPLDLLIEQTIKNTTESTPLLIFLKGDDINKKLQKAAIGFFGCQALGPVMAQKVCRE